MQYAFDLTAQNVSIPVLMNANMERPYTIVSHFTIEQEGKLLFVSRIFGGAQPDLNAMLLQHSDIIQGDAIVNLKITGQSKFGDVLLPVIVGIGGTFLFSLFSIIIFEPFFTDLKRFTIEGDLVRFTDGEIKKKEIQTIDPMTGLPVREYDPYTGLPKK